MSDVCTEIAGDSDSGLLLIADHASDRVPGDIDLGVDPAVMQKHIAVDIGIATLAPLVAARLGCPALLANVSRLVVDLHREADNPAVIPVTSDGYEIPANAALNAAGRAARIDRFWKPYHARAAELIEAHAPRMLFTLHSFTPSLESAPADRPWQIGILYNADERAPRIAIPKLEALGLVVGDNEPYSGKLLNATMNFHAEARGLPYLAIEVRNDLIDTPEGAREWAELLAPVIAAVRDAL
ncbi:N-formylglutamate amidohydrolase [Parasphingopyxis marina]|uniref:N-formylglutamate amidohydrolase n=1 Tax=Parasphingopyxis marina TaxID=2761622 RepID=A0A842HYY9_9SPHN|nr:N-formylglutamate amidohydrolase [Parasphingopyxis marina]MBC2777643.1 N-formylglutamate amidohydrolase [Parasphingopyxis marina]